MQQLWTILCSNCGPSCAAIVDHPVQQLWTILCSNCGLSCAAIVDYPVQLMALIASDRAAVHLHGEYREVVCKVHLQPIDLIANPQTPR